MCSTSKTFTTMSAAVVLVALAFATAHAGNYHIGATLTCSDCHRTQSSLTYDLSRTPLSEIHDPTYQIPRGVSVTETCLKCHDNKPGTPDVVGADVNNPSERYDGTERAAGQFAEGFASNWKGHSLPTQGSKSAGDCAVCHDSHGNANYRNLRALDGSAMGPVAFVNPAASGLDRYRRSNVGYVKNMGDKLCIGCHNMASPAQMMAPGGGGRYQKHPSSSATMIVTVSRPHSDARHWVSGTGLGFEVDGQPVPRVSFAVSTATDYVRAKAVTPSDEVFCLSCHKAHGSVHAYGMLWPYGSGEGLASTSGCNQCHNIGGK